MKGGIGQECRLGDADKYARPTTRSSRQPYLYTARDSSDVRSVTSSVLNGDRSAAFRSYAQQQEQQRGNTNNSRSKALDDTRSEEGSYFSDDSGLSDETGESVRRRKRRCYVKVMVLYMVGAAITFFTVLFWRMGFIFTGQQEGIKSSFQSYAGKTGYDQDGNMLCNGLATNCNRRANEIMYATVHNAMSSREDSFLAYNNLYPLEDALLGGFRGLTLDSCDCVRVGIQLCHGLCLAGFRRPVPTFEAIVEFMEQHPHEVVIIELQIMADSLGPLFEALEEVSGLSDLMYQHPGEEEPWPKLKELIEMNQRLLVFQHDGPDCEKGECPPGVHNTYQYMFETPFQQRGVSELMDVDSTCTVSRGWSNSSFIISNHFANDDAGLPDYDIAAVINTADILQYRLDACLARWERFERETINLLVVDFWNVGDVLQVVNTFNSELTPITEEPSAAPSAPPTTTMHPSTAPTIKDVTVQDPVTTSAPTTKAGTVAPTPVPATAEPTGSSATYLPTAGDDDDDFEEDATFETTTSSPTAPAFPSLNTAGDFGSQTTASPTAYPTYDFYSPPTATPSVAIEEGVFYDPTAAPTMTLYDETDSFYEPTATPTQLRLNVINGDFQEENVADPAQEDEDEEQSSGHSVFVPEKDTPGVP